MKLNVRDVGWAMAIIALTVGASACADRPERDQPSATGGDPSHQNHAAQVAAPPAPLRDGERFVRVGLPRPYTPVAPNGGTDEYRCFLIDPAFAERVFITGVDFQPQNVDLVHHAVFFRVNPADVRQARKLDDDAPGDGWTCFGGSGVRPTGISAAEVTGGADWIGAWAPGTRETLLTARTGFQLEPGSQIVMQLHYNLLASDGRPAGADQSAVRLRVVDGGAGYEPLRITLVSAPIELPCAPGEAGELCDRGRSVADVRRRFGEEVSFMADRLYAACNAGRPPVTGPTQRCDVPVRQPGLVHGVLGHMHLLGRSINTELNPGGPQARTLLDVPNYDFDDQRLRLLPRPVAVKPGDTLRVTCTHDATLRARLPQLRDTQPRYVVWGDGTSDEMCLAIVFWSARS